MSLLGPKWFMQNDWLELSQITKANCSTGSTEPVIFFNKKDKEIKLCRIYLQSVSLLYRYACYYKNMSMLKSRLYFHGNIALQPTAASKLPVVLCSYTNNIESLTMKIEAQDCSLHWIPKKRRSWLYKQTIFREVFCVLEDF